MERRFCPPAYNLQLFLIFEGGMRAPVLSGSTRLSLPPPAQEVGAVNYTWDILAFPATIKASAGRR